MTALGRFMEDYGINSEKLSRMVMGATAAAMLTLSVAPAVAADHTVDLTSQNVQVLQQTADATDARYQDIRKLARTLDQISSTLTMSRSVKIKASSEAVEKTIGSEELASPDKVLLEIAGELPADSDVGDIVDHLNWQSTQLEQATRLLADMVKGFNEGSKKSVNLTGGFLNDLLENYADQKVTMSFAGGENSVSANGEQVLKVDLSQVAADLDVASATIR